MKKEIKLTLETTENGEDYYELRNKMVNNLVDIELDAPLPEIRAKYKEMLKEMFCNMDDELLQSNHDIHIEYFEEKDVR